jgi:adenosylcobinamide-GDP ribazoletransferase
VTAALAFLTPFGRAGVPSPAAVRWFPLVGLLVGLGVGGVWRGAEELWTPAVAAALAVAADLALTGMLHVDGLADSADGLLPHLDRPRRLAVMSEPTIGAFGVAVVATTLLLRWAALSSMAADVLLVAGLWCLSRTLMAVILTSAPYAREQGLATAFQGSRRRGYGVALVGGLLAATLVAAGAGWAALVIVPVAWGAGAAVLALSLRRLGGYTGDVLGAVGVVAETVALLVAAARW